MLKRVLCLDVGEKRIGVAVSDMLGITAQGVTTIITKGRERDVQAVMALCDTYATLDVVVGLPRNMDGSVGFQAERVKQFAALLEERGCRIIYEDERLTTASARRTLIEADVKRAKRKQVIDKLAATYILQGFIDSGGLTR